MLFDDLNQVPPTAEKVVVINVATEVVSAVAIASALRHAGMPLLVVNCTPPGINRRLMDELAQAWRFDLVNLQLAPHGVTIDRLMQRLFADRILLLDSDAELLDPLVTARMRKAFSAPDVYGSGWLQGYDLLTHAQSGVSTPVVYRERPWIPCAMFRTSYVRAGINAGFSFMESFVVGNGVYGLADLPQQYVTNPGPPAVHNDTGGELHAWARAAGLRFDGPDVLASEGQVFHHHGVTRAVFGSGNSTALSDAETRALDRLRFTYSDLWDGFAYALGVAQSLNA